MSERTTKVVLTAEIQSYIANMDKAARATRETGTAAQKLGQQTQAFEQMGKASLAMGAGTAAGVGLAVAKWADFDEAMSAVSAATMESEGNMQRLSDAALEAGQRTAFSAEESANAIEELAKAGVSTADILSGGLDGALDLAAAGGLQVADAAGIAATALKTFNLEGSDMGHVADLLAAGAGKAMGDVTDLSAALNQSAMVANATGLSIEETTGALSAFASQGLLGSDAGTSFKSMLQALTPTSKEAAAKMDELGISAYDSQGNFVGLANFAGQLKSSLSKLSVEQQQAALKTIFGSDAIRAATVLYSEGAEGIQEWIDAVDDQGYAAEQAEKRLNNLKGDLEELGGALETALIKTGSSADGPLRAMVQWVTSAIDAYNELNPVLQGAALGVGLVTAAVGLLGGGALVTIPKIADFKIAMETLGVTGAGVRSSLMSAARFLSGPWGVALMVAGAATATFTKIIQDGRASAEEIAASLGSSADAAEALKTAAEVSDFEAFWTGDPAESLKDLGSLLDRTSGDVSRFNGELQKSGDSAGLSAIKRLGEGFEELAKTSLPDATEQFAALTKQYDLSDAQAADLLDRMPGFKTMLEQQAIAMGESADTVNLLKIATGDLVDPTTEAAAAEAQAAEAAAETDSALQGMKGAAEDTEGSIESLAEAITQFGSANLDVRSATRELEAAFDDLSVSVAENGATLDIHTEQGRANEESIDASAQKILELASATYVQTGSQEQANAVIQQGRDRLIEQLSQFGITGDAAQQYVDKLGLVPDDLNTLVKLQGAQEAEAKLNDIARNRESTVTVRQVLMEAIGHKTTGIPFIEANGGVLEYADGGISDYMRAMTAYAAGGISERVQTGIYSGGAPLIKFAELETGWEAFISGKPSERDRNRQIWAESGERLGAMQPLEDALNRVAETVGKTSPSQGVSVGPVTFTAPSQRDQFREFEDVINRMQR